MGENGPSMVWVRVFFFSHKLASSSSCFSSLSKGVYIHYCHFSFPAIIIKNINGPTFFMQVLICLT